MGYFFQATSIFPSSLAVSFFRTCDFFFTSSLDSSINFSFTVDFFCGICDFFFFWRVPSIIYLILPLFYRFIYFIFLGVACSVPPPLPQSSISPIDSLFSSNLFFLYSLFCSPSSLFPTLIHIFPFHSVSPSLNFHVFLFSPFYFAFFPFFSFFHSTVSPIYNIESSPICTFLIFFSSPSFNFRALNPYTPLSLRLFSALSPSLPSPFFLSSSFPNFLLLGKLLRKGVGVWSNFSDPDRQ